METPDYNTYFKLENCDPEKEPCLKNLKNPEKLMKVGPKRF